jgi:hypothetical protein
MIFVVGPSNGGKSTLVRGVVPEFPTLRVLDLDAEDDRSVALIRARGGDLGGWEGRWRRNVECLRLAESTPTIIDLVVDVGAGSLQTAEGRRFFVERGGPQLRSWHRGWWSTGAIPDGMPRSSGKPSIRTSA